MDIREINGLWCDDITFCQEKCDMRDCPRNQCNIRDHNIPHSFSVERPKDCPKEKAMPDRDKLIEEFEWHTIGRSRRRGDKYVVTLELRFANSILDLLRSQPQIVRCKDCKHYRYYGLSSDTVSECTIDHCYPDSEWFCADGERRTE